MKKTILTLAALITTIGVASPAENIDYSTAFNKIENVQMDQYNKVTLTIKNKGHIGVTLVDGTGKGQYLPDTVLEGKYLYPKSISNAETFTFSTTDPNLTVDDPNVVALKSKTGTQNNGNVIDIENYVNNKGTRNNKPLFVYIYDKTNNTLHKIYKEDGTRAVYRQIHSEDISTGITPETLTNSTFKLGNGYIEANDLYKMMFGEIKDLDLEKTNDKEILDKARYGVSGKTVYDYLKAEKEAANIATPADKFVTDTKVKAYIDGLTLNGVSEFEYTKPADSTPTIEFKADKGVDKILKGIAAGVERNDAVNKGQLDDKIKELNDKIDSMDSGVAKATAGVSTAVAIANLPLEFTKERPNSFAFGAGYYGKHVGFALGYGRKLIDNSLTLKVSSSINTAADVAAGVGIGYSW